MNSNKNHSYRREMYSGEKQNYKRHNNSSNLRPFPAENETGYENNRDDCKSTITNHEFLQKSKPKIKTKYKVFFVIPDNGDPNANHEKIATQAFCEWINSRKAKGKSYLFGVLRTEMRIFTRKSDNKLCYLKTAVITGYTSPTPEILKNLANFLIKRLGISRVDLRLGVNRWKIQI